MADFLLDSTVRHNIWLQRVASHEANTFDPVIQRVDKIIRDVLGSTGDRITTRKELNEIIRRIREEVGAEYTDWTDQLLEDLEAICDTSLASSASLESRYVKRFMIFRLSSSLGRFACYPLSTNGCARRGLQDG